MSDMKLATIDPRTFRDVLGCHPTGVAVITARSGTENIGLVVGSFTSISLDPPLVGFFPGKTSTTWPKIAATKRFCVNVLAADQTAICKRFASKDADKFAGLDCADSPSGLPILKGVSAWVECSIERATEIGDHYLVVGSVDALGAGEGTAPLVFHRGGYHCTGAI
ncbi:flavin reductase family protein [Sagittula sp. MA-2]|jgi:flavin reductase (DIM6/NTAB) family NADH-FMN oxidoreductase RutF|uniref:flavin reductase family protein n=1 Tax=Sagittula sp. MA-2 TaxID=3048007 RepID=UPI0024C2EFAF|nr:flavin reductase family protein [Sagittula sp. MA-2]WHZ38064.1 flavin reductase family protein [Sagittula sp. MA-2]